MKLRLLLACSWLLASTLSATDSPIPLWPSPAPGALAEGDDHTPTLTPFLPDPENASGAAIVILPGGGYGALAPHEGRGYAEWLSKHGVAAFVLKYRLGSKGYRHPVMLQDASRALRMVRAKAADWKIDPARIGIMGSSAGGHLASTLSTHFDSGSPDSPDPIERESSRPDLSILCYPVITMLEFTHKGSRKNLLGENPDPSLLEFLSNERHVSQKTPPTFLFHTWDDPSVDVQNALLYAQALRKAGVPCEMHIFQHGAHGIGLGKEKLHPWTENLLGWLALQKFVR